MNPTTIVAVAFAVVSFALYAMRRRSRLSRED
jgi:hypothetical protein